jgi:peptidoglycan/LPS O-acetylase OafA/YrhL
MQPTQQPDYLAALTPLRGIAAILVVVFHAGIFFGPLVNPAVSGLIGHGWLWVDFFFVLSGFILTHVYGGYFRERVTRAGYKKYLLARFARVYPLHLVTLGAAVALILLMRSLASTLVPIIEKIFDLSTVPASLLLVQSLHLYDTPPLNTPAWSLSAEWWVYVIFPWLVGPLFRLGRVGQGVALLGIAGLYAALVYGVAPRFGNLIFTEMGMPRGATLDMTADWGYFRCLAGFGLGMIAYRGYAGGWGADLLRRGGAFAALALEVLLGMHYGAPELALVALFPGLILAAAYNTGAVGRALTVQPLKRLGDWSFSIYLVHMPLVYVRWAMQLAENPDAFAQLPGGAPDYAANWAWTLALLATTVAVAAGTHRWVEVPARQYLSRRAGKATPAAQPIAA